jgi:RHS repeat-associated protein
MIKRITHGKVGASRLLAVLLGFAVLAMADAGDIKPLDVAEPKLDRPAAETGAYAVNDRTGAATYSYSFRLPPARGVGPALGLVYSSNGAIRGGIAQGWELTGLASVRRDAFRERTAGSPEYVAYFGTSIVELRAVTGDLPLSLTTGDARLALGNSDNILPPGARTITAWRAKIDRDFTRFYKVDIPGRSYWVAQTTDGRTFFFGDRDNTSLDGDWRLSHVVDRNGNETKYFYETLLWRTDGFNDIAPSVPVDMILTEMQYSINSTANLASHASVRLDWSLSTACSPSKLPSQVGFDLPVGAQLDLVAGSRRILGLKQLDAVTTFVRDSMAASWRAAHQWRLEYDPRSSSCNGTVSPRRRLARILELGSPSSSVTLTTPGPTVTFTYGADPDWNQTASPGMPGKQRLVIPLPQTLSAPTSTAAGAPIRGLSVSAGSAPLRPIYSMMADINGDGLPDLVRATGEPCTCQATWYQNRDGIFDAAPSGAIPLPDVAPQGACSITNPVGSGGFLAGSHDEGECSLAGAWRARIVPASTGAGCRDGEIHEHTKLVHRWIDVNGDGRVDLVTEQYENRDREAPPARFERLSDIRWADGEIAHVYRCNSDYYSFPQQDQRHKFVWQYRQNILGPDGKPRLAPPVEWHLPATIEGLPEIAKRFDEPPPGPVPPAPESLAYDLIDFNRDGIPDLVTTSLTYQQPVDKISFAENKGWRYCSVNSDPVQRRWQLNVYLGTGSGFEQTPVHMVWGPPIPAVESQVSTTYRIFRGSIVRPEDISCPEHLADVGLVDINGDGLPDLLAEGPVYFNRGLSLDPLPVRLPGFITAEWRDFDHDGVPDFACLEPNCSNLVGGQGLVFGNSGGFNRVTSEAETPVDRPPNAPDWFPEVLGRTSRLSEEDTLTFDYRLKHTIRDFVDLYGDGIGEPYYLNCGSSDSASDRICRASSVGLAADFALPQCNVSANSEGWLCMQRWHPGDGQAPGLLTKVENGKGATIKFEYARRDSIAEAHIARPGYATEWPDWIAPTRQPSVWLVSAVSVDPGSSQPPSRTTYTYEDPVFLSDDGTLTNRRFRGFQAVTTTLPAIAPDEQPPIQFERFSYTLDPDGVLDYRSLSEFSFDRVSLREGYQKLTRDQTTYVVENYLGGVRFVHPNKAIHVECQPSFDASVCDESQPPCATVTNYEYRGLSNVRVETLFSLNSGNNAALMWALERTIEQTTTTPGRPSLTREHRTSHIAIDGGLLVLLAQRIDVQQGETAYHEDYFYDGGTRIDHPGSVFGVTRGLMTKKRVYRDLTLDHVNDIACRPDGFNCVDYGSWFDSSTGNKVRDVRPSEMARSAVDGDPSRATSYTRYDLDPDFALFAIRVTNALGHHVERKFDFGTGLQLTELGPNWRIGRPPGCEGLCPAGPVPEEKDWAYDGLGRLLTEKAPHDDAASGYLPLTVRSVSYPADFRTSIEQTSLDWTDALGVRMTTFRHYDGLGRIMHIEVPLPLSDPAGQMEEHSYVYDARGNLASSTDPDPTNDSARVTRTFTHDSRGRLTSVTAQDGAKLAVTFTPWEKLIRDPDGGANHQLFDGFGQLREVDESGTTTVDRAHTSYDYDGAGRLIKVHDADGHETSLFHDGQGHRVSITRPTAKVWLYHYDSDGNLIRKEDPDHRVTQYKYDPLGRQMGEIVSDARLPVGLTPAELGLGRTDLTYDNGANGIGRLTGAAMFDHIPATAGESPYAEVSYSHDSLGNRSSENWQLNLPAVGSRLFAMTRAFGPQSNPLAETLPTGQTVSWTYDTRGKIDAVIVQGQTVASYKYTVAGGVRTRESPAATPAQVRTYSYDLRGRLLKDRVEIGAASVGRTYGYSGDGDVRTLRVEDNLSDRPPLDTTMTFGYDALHRLTSANGGTELSYSTDLSYSPAGSILTSTVLGAVSVPDRSAIKYVYGDGSLSDPQAVSAFQANSRDLAQFHYDSSGNLTDRITPNWPGFTTHYVYDPNHQIRKVTDEMNRWEQYYYDPSRTRFLAVSPDGYRFYLGPDYEVDVKIGGSGRVEQNAYVNANGESVVRLTTCTGVCQDVAPSLTVLYHDRRGDLLTALRSSGEVESHFIYGAFGEVLYKHEPGSGDWRLDFNGKEHDELDGLLYYGYRYCDPLRMQWTSGDPLPRYAPEVSLEEPQRQNLFAFSQSNPLRYRDFKGLWDSGYDVLLASQHGHNVFERYFDYAPLETRWDIKGREGRALGLKGQFLDMWMRAPSPASRLGVFCASIGGCQPSSDSSIRIFESAAVKVAGFASPDLDPVNPALEIGSGGTLLYGLSTTFELATPHFVVAGTGILGGVAFVSAVAGGLIGHGIDRAFNLSDRFSIWLAGTPEEWDQTRHVEWQRQNIPRSLSLDPKLDRLLQNLAEEAAEQAH